LYRRKKEFRQLKTEADPETIFLFADSSELSLMPTITRCWMKIGQQRLILTPGVRAQKRWNWGAVNVVTGETVHIVHERRNNIGFRRLLAAISRHFPGQSHERIARMEGIG
jgi:hypothetical protein